MAPVVVILVIICLMLAVVALTLVLSRRSARTPPENDSVVLPEPLPMSFRELAHNAALRRYLDAA